MSLTPARGGPASGGSGRTRRANSGWMNVPFFRKGSFPRRSLRAAPAAPGRDQGQRSLRHEGGEGMPAPFPQLAPQPPHPAAPQQLRVVAAAVEGDALVRLLQDQRAVRQARPIPAGDAEGLAEGVPPVQAGARGDREAGPGVNAG